MGVACCCSVQVRPVASQGFSFRNANSFPGVCDHVVSASLHQCVAACFGAIIEGDRTEGVNQTPFAPQRHRQGSGRPTL